MLIKLKAILVGLIAELKDIWNRGKMYFLGLLAILVTLEYRQLKEYLLLKAGQKEMKKDTQEDKDLAAKEKATNAQADALVKQSQQLPSTEQPVQPDWYTKSGDDK
jgi:hypothetical protein